MSLGKVYLVGAGPGDFGLLSLKARQLMETAEVVVYDRLADDRLLGLLPSDAERIYVGKASSDHTMKQDDINQLLVDKAKAGKKVVRLKGGDPFVFGRGGEEALVLKEAGISFEIVPGITSAIAVPAYAGIPVTHRGIATSFTVITGHEEPGKGKSSIRWDHIAQGADTLVFLMGVENLPFITRQLMEHGRTAETPVAVIQWGTKPQQRVLTSTLAKVAQDVAEAGLTPPAIFLVGDVVRLRDELAWFDQRPLFGKRVLVTRAREQASELTTRLEELGAECMEAPAILVKPPESYQAVDESIQRLKEYRWLIFTSVNGVQTFFRRMGQGKKDSRDLAGLQIAAIGIPTAKELEKYGISADLVPVEFRAEGLVDALAGQIKSGDRVLIPRAKEAREILPEKLRELGALVDVVPVYQTVVGEVDGQKLGEQLAEGQIDIVTFTSSSTVTNLLSLLDDAGREALARQAIICIGPITAATCISHGLKPAAVAEEYSIGGLTAAVEKWVMQGE